MFHLYDSVVVEGKGMRCC